MNTNHNPNRTIEELEELIENIKAVEAAFERLDSELYAEGVDDWDEEYILIMNRRMGKALRWYAATPPLRGSRHREIRRAILALLL